MPNYIKDITELQSRAVFWWPSFLSVLETNASIIPTLIQTQDKFLSLLTLADSNPYKLFDLLKSSEFPANLFLKHLVVLSDFGGEQVQRLNKQFGSVFPDKVDGKNGFTFTWKEKNYSYKFKKLPVFGNLDNKHLGIDGPSVSKNIPLDEVKEDLIMVLLYGSNSLNESTAHSLMKCDIGNLLGNKEQLEQYVKQKYIWVSRITGGAQANTLGQVAQTYVVDYLKKKLGSDYSVVRNGIIQLPGNQHIPFDILVSRNEKYVGVEVTFQVTTNSTIERKAGQAKGRHDLMHKSGYFIAHIVDGAGNFQRRSAISMICTNSDCTVAYAPEEFDTLVSFIKEKI